MVASYSISPGRQDAYRRELGEEDVADLNEVLGARPGAVRVRAVTPTARLDFESTGRTVGMPPAGLPGRPRGAA